MIVLPVCDDDDASRKAQSSALRNAWTEGSNSGTSWLPAVPPGWCNTSMWEDCVEQIRVMCERPCSNTR